MAPYESRVTAMLGGIALLAATSASAGNWANIQPAYNADAQHATVRLEGGADLGKRGKFYGFLDLDGNKENPVDLEQFYGEARFMGKIGKSPWAAAAELDVGSGMEDFLRIGATYTPKTGEGNFTQLRLWPFETSGGRGPQVSAFSNQQLSDRVAISGLLDYNIDPNTAYIEAELDINIAKKAALFAQARGFGTIDDRMDITPVGGVKWNF